jgi:hypothetical protein
MLNIDESTDVLLETAREYGSGNALPGDVVAAAYRLAASKLHDHGSHLHAQDLERAADQAESSARLGRGLPRGARSS